MKTFNYVIRVKTIVLTLILLLSNRATHSQTACACIYENVDGDLECFSGNCGNGNLNLCVQQINPTWYQGNWSVPAGMTLCEYLLEIVTLPIELTRFEGSSYNNTNIIEWETSSEYNNDYFTLERSIDGEHWERIYQVKGAGNSSSNVYYSYNDNHIVGINYYKLTQYDFDGVGKESFIISVSSEDERKIIKTTIYDLMGKVYEYTTSPGLYIIHKEYNHGNPEILKLYK